MLPVFRAVLLVTFTPWKASALSHVTLMQLVCEVEGYGRGGGAGTWEVGKKQVGSKL